MDGTRITSINPVLNNRRRADGVVAKVVDVPKICKEGTQVDSLLFR